MDIIKIAGEFEKYGTWQGAGGSGQGAGGSGQGAGGILHIALGTWHLTYGILHLALGVRHYWMLEKGNGGIAEWRKNFDYCVTL